MTNTKLPTFQWSFLKPKYWGLWLTIGLWRLLLCLPYPILVHIGKGFGNLFGRLKFGQRRLAIAQRNLELSFPELSEQEIKKLLKQHQESIGMAIIETGMAWFWSDKRIKKWCKIEGAEYLTKNLHKGILLVGIHFLTLELGARLVGMVQKGIGVYRPNGNPVFDWLQVRGRMRANKDMLDRHDLRGMIKALRRGEMIWYAPDHDYGRRSNVFVPFFGVEKASTTTGTYFLLRSSPKSAVIPFSPLRATDYSGYTLKISPPVDFSEVTNEIDIATKMNKVIEKEILQGVEQYMWLHRRYKTRPNENDPSLYD